MTQTRPFEELRPEIQAWIEEGVRCGPYWCPDDDSAASAVNELLLLRRKVLDQLRVDSPTLVGQLEAIETVIGILKAAARVPAPPTEGE